MARKHDLQEFRQACNEVGLSKEERYEASEALHREKQSSGQPDRAYGELLDWLRQWKDS